MLKAQLQLFPYQEDNPFFQDEMDAKEARQDFIDLEEDTPEDENVIID